ncbi:MAG: dienelactone hydrolase family protein [Proteobacteria bacterium]|nr:dienelactone hydrolase family protein [Pseudomonadota bacterium]
MAAANGDIVTEEITCPGGMPALVARPKTGGRRPSVILMHERYGLVSHSRDLARRCARDGFFVIAPDFFHKYPDQDALHAGTARYDFSDSEAIASLRDAIAALEQSPHADENKVAVAGFCQTGRHPIVFAAEVPVAAVVVWYGAAAKREWPATERQPKPMEEIISKLPCPLFGAFGSDDHIIAVEDVRRFRNTLEDHGKSYEIHLYAGAPHGWLNDTMAGRYRKKQAEAAWAAQQFFLKRVLEGEAAHDLIGWRFESETPADYDFSKNIRQE